MTKHLPAELKSLVNEVSHLWGEIILEEAGRDLFLRVESLRKYLKLFRQNNSLSKSTRLLEDLQKKMNQLSPRQWAQITHSFSVLLELTNICENSVRSQKIRVRQKSRTTHHIGNEIYLVLTAHPTESRAPETVETLNEIQKIISTGLFEKDRSLLENLKPQLRRLWHLRMAKQEKPEVRDEASYLYSILFKPETISQLMGPSSDKLFLRTWVGGDKDGHPGVNEKVMLECLQGSRTHILKVLDHLFMKLENELLGFIQLSRGDLAEAAQRTLNNISPVKQKIRFLENLRDKDAIRVDQFKRAFHRLIQNTSPVLSKSLISLPEIQRLTQMFPSLVIPLELREDSQVFRDLSGPKNKVAIFRMLQQISRLSSKHDPRGYARGLIISMCEDINDLKGAEFFQKKAFAGKAALPIIPLFEKIEALEKGPSILKEWINLRKLKKIEVMLGYSDSSKEAGVLPSRIAIRKAIENFEALSNKVKGLEITYFHGSGGSVARGGGSLENQTAHWPQAAFDRYKVTLQGEMIQRTFSTPEIFDQYLSKVRYLGFQKRYRKNFRTSPVLLSFAEEITHFYRQSVSDPDFLEMVEQASAYRFLEQLRIGSRPSKRRKLEGISSLRAIPWILSWTQTRILLPDWWGFGTAYQHMNSQAKKELRKLARSQDPLLMSYLQQLGFTLAKVEPAIWFLYLKQSGLSQKNKDIFSKSFQKELALTLKAFRELTGKKDVLWFKPWLKESIRLRSPLIHPLNLAQLKAWKTGQSGLLREASVGIACGMLTTG